MTQSLVVFKEQLNTGFQAEFATLIDQLRQNTRRSNLFGSTETLRNERAMIFHRLNEMCLLEMRESFTALNDRNGWGL